MCIFASALYIKLGKQLILLYFKTMQNSDYEQKRFPVESPSFQILSRSFDFRGKLKDDMFPF